MWRRNQGHLLVTDMKTYLICTIVSSGKNRTKMRFEGEKFQVLSLRKKRRENTKFGEISNQLEMKDQMLTIEINARACPG